jgi:DNA-binding transcriptional MerR regulator
MEALTIGQLARRADVTPEAVRYYERRGVLETPRRDGHGRRRYGLQVLDELRLLKCAQAVGFSLEEIGSLLALTRKEPVPCQDMCRLVEQRLAALEARIRELDAARKYLSGALAACDTNQDCVVADRLVRGVPLDPVRGGPNRPGLSPY